jgi:hypothetical protein
MSILPFACPVSNPASKSAVIADQSPGWVAQAGLSLCDVEEYVETTPGDRQYLLRPAGSEDRYEVTLSRDYLYGQTLPRVAWPGAITCTGPDCCESRWCLHREFVLMLMAEGMLTPLPFPPFPADLR